MLDLELVEELIVEVVKVVETLVLLLLLEVCDVEVGEAVEVTTLEVGATVAVPFQLPKSVSFNTVGSS